MERSHSLKEALESVVKGTRLGKVKCRLLGNAIYDRVYSLDLENFRILYEDQDHDGGKPFFCFSKAAADRVVQLEDVCEVRSGHGTDTFNEVTKDKAESELRKVKFGSGGEVWDLTRDHCFSIVFKGDRKPLDLVATDPEVRNHWLTALGHLIVTTKSLMKQKEHDRYLMKQFKAADKSKSGALSVSECRELLEQLNIKLPDDEFKRLFNDANVTKTKNGKKEEIDEQEFVAFYLGLLRKPMLDQIFSKYADSLKDSQPRMTQERLATFLMTEQKVEMSSVECQKIIAAYEPSSDKTSLSALGFTQFMLFSQWQDILSPAHKNLVYQDMSQPLAHYWIASSHNTYLLGNQVTGESSVDAYIKALKGGCRCVEMDCWDGDHGEPIIYHGWTMTSKILFKDVLKDAILQYAFHASEYPLILSIENHCSVEQQDKMAKHLVEILGSMLYRDPVDEKRQALPSPEDLKFKVLIKAKRLRTDDANDDQGPDVDELDEKRKQKPEKISKNLSDLVNCVEAIKFKGFGVKGKYYQMSSFGETKTTSFCNDPDDSKAFVKYNTKQLSRIYPGAKRQDSSNLDPIPPWNCGCQIVALNYQMKDKLNLANKMKFADNGGCGYLLKPRFLRVPDPKYSPVSDSAIPADEKAVVVKVEVVSGHHIPKPDGDLKGEVIDPYVKVRIRGHLADKGLKGKTETVKNNGFNPVWCERYGFRVKYPSLAFLELRVKDYSKSGVNKVLGSFICPLAMVQQGFRRATLMDYSGASLSPASLLVHIELCPEN